MEPASSSVSAPGSLSRLHHPAHKPYKDIKHIAIAILEDNPAEDQRHVGILYKHDSARADVRFLELEWHHRLKAEPPSDPVFWAEPRVPPEKAHVLARFCKLVAEKYGGSSQWKLSYAILYTDGRFDLTTGEFLTRDGRGLTCATFVMAMFKTHEISLVLQDEWPHHREGDKAWHDKIVQCLARRADASHVEAVKNELGCARYRPEEVAAAALAEALPVGFQYAESTGLLIVEHLRQSPPTSG
jgi:hypothetical protein